MRAWNLRFKVTDLCLLLRSEQWGILATPAIAEARSECFYRTGERHFWRNIHTSYTRIYNCLIKFLCKIQRQKFQKTTWWKYVLNWATVNGMSWGRTSSRINITSRCARITGRTACWHLDTSVCYKWELLDMICQSVNFPVSSPNIRKICYRMTPFCIESCRKINVIYLSTWPDKKFTACNSFRPMERTTLNTLWQYI